MSFIDKIRQKPHAEKVSLIRIVIIIVTALLILLWILSAHFSKHPPKDTTIFQTIGKGITDIKNNFRK